MTSLHGDTIPDFCHFFLDTIFGFKFPAHNFLVQIFSTESCINRDNTSKIATKPILTSGREDEIAHIT